MTDEQKQKPASAQDVIDTLKSMDQSLKALVAHFGALRVPVNGNVPPSRSAYTIPNEATDSMMDTQYGDPEIKTKDPRDWTGDVMRGAHFSQCPPEYLDQYAEFLDWMAEQAEAEGKTTQTGKPVAFYKRRDASLARGWAKRLRGGWKPPVEQESAFPSDTTTEVPEEDLAF